MKKITVIIDNMENAAFENEELEAGRILELAAKEVKKGTASSHKLRDFNGNTVGRLIVE